MGRKFARLSTSRWASGMVFGLTLGWTLGCGVFDRDRGADGADSEIHIDLKRYRVDLQGDEPALGGEHPLVTIVVFTDYACPPCRATWQVMDNLAEDYGADLRIVYQSFTVPGFGRGEQAVEAAFAAGAQGKFWEMHRRLFEHFGEFDRPTLQAHAEALALDVPKFLEEIDTGVHASTRLRHRRQAKRLGVAGLPTSFVNGLYLPGFAEEPAWHALIDDEMKRARGLLAEGVRRPDLYREMMATASTAQVVAPQGAEALRKDLAEQQPAAAAKVVAPSPDKRYDVALTGPSIGPQRAPVVVVEFVDVQCPYCRRAWTDELQKLTKTKGDEVRFVIRQLPLPIHPGAKGAAIAGLAAARQGKFWEFHDRLMQRTDELGRSVFVAMARELGLDEARFIVDFEDPALAQQVDDDVAAANALGVGGTPGFFVNGRYLSGFLPGQLPALIDEELAHAQELAKREGVPREDVFAKLMAEAVQPKDYPNP